MLIKKINNINYFVNNDEFNIIHHNEYTNLKIIDKLGYFETIISFINKISHEHNLFFYNVTHGGFIPLNCSKYCNHTFIQCNNLHFNNIDNNCKNLNLSSNITICEHFKEDNELNNFILYDESLNFNNKLLEIYNFNVIISKINIDNSLNYFKYNWINTNLFIYVNYKYNTYFCELFKYFLFDDKMTLHYDNLNHLCIMVKNAGPQFEQMLTYNINYFDKWTILDTGSTDETIDIINRILVGKKYGNLYCEPFINFKDSRNRLLELAGKECKYITMLDDTYVIDGDLREFLKEVRGDQYSNSFTLYISSNDSLYGSNRIIRSDSDLKYIYRIHEVITDKNNINIVIPQNKVKIIDRRFDYMEKRTMERKQLDLKLLFEELKDNPNDPRTYYYLAQTYNLLEDYEKAYEYFLKRLEIINAGFIQERYDSAFEAGRIANFKLNKLWDECLKLYEKAIQIDDSRPDAYYFIGIHYYLENNYQQAYKYLKKGFELGFPIHCQYSLKPTLSYHFLPKFLTRICYELEDYILGENASQFFLLNNKNDSQDYEEILSWYQIYKKLNIYQGPKIPKISQKPILCFVADGGFNQWSGSNILTTGVGGSETYIIEMARYIGLLSNYDVYVFCNTTEENEEIFENVIYRHLNTYYQFINTNYVKHCIISRYSEYLPVTFKGFTENVYFVIHDLTPSGIIIPINLKLKNIFCLTEWHVEYFTNIFPNLKHLTVSLYYGIDDKFKLNDSIELNNKIKNKIKNKFIYSSFPNRGLLELLQIWPKIYEKYPTSTLHIYSDINNKWSNDVEPYKMQLIKNILDEYNYKENELGIYYHGWVNKDELANAWSTSDIWFYPCTFMETFCLTALEAASSKTLCITNDLAALQNTVADRGVIILGDPTTEEWKQEALNKIFYYMNEKNDKEKQELVNINYDWSKILTWKNQAMKLLNEYIYPNDIYEYKDMFNWTNDLPQGEKNIFLKNINYFNNNYLKIKLGKKINILEIGTYAGISLIELVKQIPNSYGIGIDMWSNYNENNLLNIIDNYDVKGSFYKNIKNANLEDRIKAIQINSTIILMEFIKDNRKFDFIYVDGSHLLLDCYTDLLLSWQILEIGGILVIDDYLYKIDNENILNSPYEAVNHFFKLFEGKYKLLDIGYRVFLEKI